MIAVFKKKKTIYTFARGQAFISAVSKAAFLHSIVVGLATSCVQTSLLKKERGSD